MKMCKKISSASKCLAILTQDIVPVVVICISNIFLHLISTIKDEVINKCTNFLCRLLQSRTNIMQSLVKMQNCVLYVMCQAKRIYWKITIITIKITIIFQTTKGDYNGSDFSQLVERKKLGN